MIASRSQSNKKKDMFRKLEILIETQGSEHGDNHTLYNKNDSNERLDYDVGTTLMTYTDDNYINNEEILNTATEDRLTELFVKFSEVGTNKY